MTDLRWSARAVREGLLWVGAVAGVLCLTLAFLGLLLGIKPIVFESGSMSPTIRTGDLAISRSTDGADLEVGDIVTVKNVKGVRVTHRIRSISRTDGGVTLVLKGDANNVVDQNAYQVTEADRVLFSIPKAGYVASGLSGRWGTFAGGLLVGLVLVTAFGRRRHDPEPEVVVETVVERVEVPVERLRRRPVLAAAIGAAMIGLLVVGTKQTGAFWTDAVTVSSGSFTMKATPLRITSCTVDASNRIVLTWTYPDAGNTSNPSTNFVVRSTNSVPGTPGTVAANLRTFTSSAFNSKDGEIWVVAVNGAVETESAHATYSFGPGNGGGNKNCTAPVT